MADWALTTPFHDASPPEPPQDFGPHSWLRHLGASVVLRTPQAVATLESFGRGIILSSCRTPSNARARTTAGTSGILSTSSRYCARTSRQPDGTDGKSTRCRFRTGWTSWHSG